MVSSEIVPTLGSTFPVWAVPPIYKYPAETVTLPESVFVVLVTDSTPVLVFVNPFVPVICPETEISLPFASKV